jgi:predicted MFS family arabinose efflux permease
MACLAIATVTPLSALLLTNFPPIFNSITFVLAGSAINARLVGFNTQLLDLAPDDMRSTYSGIRGTTIALTAPLPFLAGGLIEVFSFQFTFSLVSGLMLAGLLFNLWEYRYRGVEMRG